MARRREKGCWAGKEPKFCRISIIAKIYLFLYIEHYCMLVPAKGNAHNNPTKKLSPHFTDRNIEAKKKLRLEISQLVSLRGWETRASRGLDPKIPSADLCPPLIQPWLDQPLS